VQTVVVIAAKRDTDTIITDYTSEEEYFHNYSRIVGMWIFVNSVIYVYNFNSLHTAQLFHVHLHSEICHGHL
jgi:hypothetical protein